MLLITLYIITIFVVGLLSGFYIMTKLQQQSYNKLVKGLRERGYQVEEGFNTATNSPSLTVSDRSLDAMRNFDEMAVKKVVH